MAFPGRWSPKTLGELLREQQTWAPDDSTTDEIQRLIDVLNLHRPLGRDGKHGNLHTSTCGCDLDQYSLPSLDFAKKVDHEGPHLPLRIEEDEQPPLKRITVEIAMSPPVPLEWQDIDGRPTLTRADEWPDDDD